MMMCNNIRIVAEVQRTAGEFLCRFYRDREPLSAITLTTDTLIMTAISKGYSYNKVFSRQIKALGKKSDDIFLA